MNKLNKQIKERPIILSADEVRAVLDGRKTQHRILVKKNDDTAILFNPKYYGWRYEGLEFEDDGCCTPNPQGQHFMEELESNYDPSVEHDYTENYVSIGYCPYGCIGDLLRINPDLMLVITDLRIERVRDITIADAESLGLSVCGYEPMIGHGGTFLYKNYMDSKAGCWDAKQCYETYWISKHGKQSWDSNVWVWVIDFEVVGGVK